MIRWSFVLPRLVLLLIVWLALTYGIGPALHWTLVTTGQAVMGAKVEIAEVKTSWLLTSLEMNGIQVADRSRPMTNLIEADAIRLYFDSAHLLRKRFVIEHADLQGVRFGTPRTTSGELEVAPKPAEPTWTDKIVESASREATNRLETWFEQLKVEGLEKLESELQTVQVAQEISARWPREYQAMRDRISAIELRVRNLKDLVERPNTNPLRFAQILTHASADVQQTLRDIDTIKTELQRLSQQVPVDRQALVQAQQNDRDKLKSMIKLPKIDGETITDAVFGQEQVDRVQEVMAWVAWVRSAVPNPDKDFQAVRTEGVDVRFAGAADHPLFWLQEASLTGSLERGVGGPESRTFQGHLFDFCSHPQRLGRPTRLELELTGNTPVTLNASLDRTTPVARDQILIQLPRVAMGEKPLGKPQSVALAMPAGELSITVNLNVVDQQLDGRIDLHRDGSPIEVRHVSERLGGTYVHSLLGSSLESLKECDATIHLSGTLKKPELRLESPMGPILAQKLNETANAAIADQLGRLEQKLQGELEKQLADLESQVGNLNELRQIVSAHQNQLGSLREVVARVTGLGRLR